MYEPNAYQDYMQRKESKKSFFGRMGLIPKIIIAIAIILIATTLLFGFDVSNIPAFIMNVITVGIAGGLIFFAIKGVLGEAEPEPFSVTEDFRTKLTNQCVKLKPLNVYKLWLRGEGMRSRALIGNIIGLGHIPYKVTKLQINKEGNVVYFKNSKGKTIKDNEGNPIPKTQLLQDGDGDTVFIVKSGFFGQPDIIRCHRKFHSELVGDVYIKDLGLVPFGEYFYPSKQWGEDVQKIMLQNEIEAITQTHSNTLDLISNVTTMSIAGDPFYQKVLALRNEEIAKAPSMTPTGMGMGGAGIMPPPLPYRR